MAHKKAGGSTHLGRDSQPQYLGTKVGDGETVNAGQVLVRQHGTPIFPGKNVEKGRNDTLYSRIAGIVKFMRRKRTRFDGKKKMTTFVAIVPANKKAETGQ
ncbi:MAG: 50S ribosomal protein L27 [Patescibacteria group bacterium]